VEEANKPCNIQYHILPDGSKIEIGHEAFVCVELLFDPSRMGIEMPGIPQAVIQCLQATEIDNRKDLLSNILLIGTFDHRDSTGDSIRLYGLTFAGGTVRIKGFKERLYAELCKLLPEAIVPYVTILYNPSPAETAWIGGSVLANTSTFQQMWISKEEYDESGPSIAYRRRSCW
jgi:actin-related protein